MTKAKTVSTINKARKALFAKGKAIVARLRESLELNVKSNEEVIEHMDAMQKATGQQWVNLSIAHDHPTNSQRVTDPEAAYAMIEFALAVRQVHTEAHYASFSGNQLKALGAEKAMAKAKSATTSWWSWLKQRSQYANQIEKKNSGNASGGARVVKGKSGKLAKNGKVVDLRAVADQQAKNYINALKTLIDCAPDSVDAELYRDMISDVKAVHGFE